MMMQKHQHQKHNPQEKTKEIEEHFKKTQEAIQKVKEKGLKDFSDRDIFHPDGFASAIVKEFYEYERRKDRRDFVPLRSVQLRRIYAEIRSMYEKIKENPNQERVAGLKYNLYKLYAIVHYQVNRKVIDEMFGKLVIAILDSLEEKFNEESLRKASDFFMAMIAYSKKE